MPVLVSADLYPYNHPAEMECGLADALWRWETTIVARAARQYLGHRIRRLVQIGAYVCRQQVGSGRNYTSEHAFGRAIDIWGWTLDDGTTVTFQHDWRRRDGRAAFLHAVAAGACGIFSVVLTPSDNAAHSGHMHVDIGPYRFCGRGNG